MIGIVIGATVVGLIAVPVARMVMPSRQIVGVIVTVLLGAFGFLVGTWLAYDFGYSNSNDGFKVIPFSVGVIVAIRLIAAYFGIARRRHDAW